MQALTNTTRFMKTTLLMAAMAVAPLALPVIANEIPAELSDPDGQAGIADKPVREFGDR